MTETLAENRKLKTENLSAWAGPARLAPLDFTAILLSLLLAVSGCNRPAETAGKPVATGSTPQDAVQAEGQCEGPLSSIDHIFRIQSLGQTTSIRDGVARLNDWQRACGPAGAPDSPVIPAEVANLFSAEQLKALGEKRFSLRDGERLRDCLVEAAIARYAVGTGQTELEKVTNVFGHVVRGVGLIPDSARDVPLAPYEIYLLGKGSAEERAWIFADLLRQLKIDVVLLFPKFGGETPAMTNGRPFLVGVLLDENVYLFDPQLGVPIPAVTDAASAGSPSSGVATLNQATTDPAVLKQLDAGGQPYPISAESIARSVVAIPGDTSFWSLRMQGLASHFVGERAMIISDPLEDAVDGSSGLWARVGKAGARHWKSAELTLWEYPEARFAARDGFTREQLDTLEGLMLPFKAYMVWKVDPRTRQPVLVSKDFGIDKAAAETDPDVRINVWSTEGEQMRARLAQIEGDFAEAIRSYTEVRGRSKEVLDGQAPPRERSMHARAIDDAFFWTGLCKFEQGNFKVAADTLQNYRKRAESGNWGRESRYLLALSRAASGDRSSAIEVLSAVEPDDPEYAGYQLLIRQWQK